MSDEEIGSTLHSEVEDGVCSIVLTRAHELDTITPTRATSWGPPETADAAPGVRVILLRAEAVGFRDAVRERDAPFQHYGSRPGETK